MKNVFNKENIKFCINDKGTLFHNKHPLFKTEYIFDSRFTME
jgi:hypothetical protein